MEEIFLEKGNLVDQEEWEKRISELKERIKETNTKDLVEEIRNAVVRRFSKGCGILFSGGIDSTLIAFLCRQISDKKDFTCFTVGLEGAPDIEWAKKIAEKLDLNLVCKELSLDEFEKVLIRAAKIFSKLDLEVHNPAVLFGVGGVVISGIELAKNTKEIFSGLGSEEIFAGYERHAESSSINDECWKGLINMRERDLIRDTMIGKEFNKKILTPFLDSEVIVTAMGIPGEEKIKQDFKKYVLRKAAIELGLPEEFAWRKKKAAQYGSRFDKAISKLAKNAGFQLKKDYLKSFKKAN